MNKVGIDKFESTVENPYLEALDWIVGTDPMNLTVASPNLIQRFTAAYLYLATSRTRPWASCGPAQIGEDEVSCVYRKLIGVSPIQTTDIPNNRWLSSAGECTWAGVICDGHDEVRVIELCKSFVAVVIYDTCDESDLCSLVRHC